MEAVLVMCFSSFVNFKLVAFRIDFTSLGTIGHVAHGKSTVVKAISGVQVCIKM